MNQRIQKLYKETTGKDWVYDFDPDYAGKFAELIVRECSSICRGVGDAVWAEQHQSNIGTARTCDAAILLYFGVEE